MAAPLDSSLAAPGSLCTPIHPVATQSLSSTSHSCFWELCSALQGSGSPCYPQFQRLLHTSEPQALPQYSPWPGSASPALPSWFSCVSVLSQLLTLSSNSRASANDRNHGIRSQNRRRIWVSLLPPSAMGRVNLPPSATCASQEFLPEL